MHEEKKIQLLDKLTKGNAADIITRLKHGSEVNLSSDSDERYLNAITKGAF